MQIGCHVALGALNGQNVDPYTYSRSDLKNLRW